MPGKSALPSMSAVCASMKVASALLEACSASVRPCDASTANNTTRCDVKRRRPERLMSRLYTSPVTCGAAFAVPPASADAPLLCAIETPKTFFTGRRTTLVNAAVWGWHSTIRTTRTYREQAFGKLQGGATPRQRRLPRNRLMLRRLPPRGAIHPFLVGGGAAAALRRLAICRRLALDRCAWYGSCCASPTRRRSQAWCADP